MVFTETSFIIWISVAALSICVGIVQFCGFLKFKALTFLIIIKKRYPKFVLIESVASMILLFIVIPLWTNVYLEATPSLYSDSYTLSEFLWHFTWIFFAMLDHFIVDLEAIRLWLIFYDLNYLHSAINQQWKTQIDETFTEKDWFLKNKGKYNSKKYLIKRVAMYYLLSITIPTLIFIKFAHQHLYYAQFTDGMFLSVPILVIVYTYYKCPKNLNDNFLFHTEFRNTTLVYCSGMVFYLANQIGGYLDYTEFTIPAIAFTATYSLGAPSILSTLYIPSKILKMDQWTSNELERAISTFSSISSTNHDLVMNVIHDNDKHKHTKLSFEEKLRMTLQTEETLEPFIHWMYREFSSESILAFIEFYQYKTYLIKYINDNDVKNKNDVKQFPYSLYENIPKSTIVHSVKYDNKSPHSPSTSTKLANADLIPHFRSSCHALYEKYLKHGCELELNISAGLRQKYDKQDSENFNIDVIELANLFDEVITEMYKFMRLSFQRYDDREELSEFSSSSQ